MAPFPVCCIAKIPIAILNKLLTDARAGSNDLAPGSECELAIVEACDDGSSMISDKATIPPLEESFRPYISASTDQAAEPQHVAGASNFAVLDQQSPADETVVLVSRGQDGTVGGTARVTFESIQLVLVSLEMGTIGFSEIQSIAESQGEVYGRPAERPKKGGLGPRKRLGGP
ncbi:hypothetical protein PG994_007297 [Apiospora phragmitis]|uniref:Uncharacterized protein n=1 Tax=Apiospora phragmitis TaxID=2905665 RepID=A0ABR1V0E8_9PEZI